MHSIVFCVKNMENKKIIKFSILFFISIVLFFSPFLVQAATLSVNPTSGTFEVGDKVTVKILVSTSQPINAISGIVSFPLSIFVVESVSKAGSILNFWVTEPDFSKGAGTLSFEGVTLGGFPGGTDTVVTVVLRATRAGSGAVIFKSGQVLANDGQGTDVTSEMTGATFIVQVKKQEPIITKPEPVLEIPAPVKDIHQESPILQSPEIELVKKFGEQAIAGTSNYNNAQALLTIVAESGVKVFIMTETDANGEFLMLIPQTLKSGTYKISAVIIQKDFSSSDPSNEIKIKIGNSISDISLEIRISLLVLFLILLYFILRNYFYLKKNKKFRLYVKKETEDVEDVLHKSFDLLNEDVDVEMAKKTILTRNGKIKEIKSDLHDAEELISKEIKDIKKL